MSFIKKTFKTAGVILLIIFIIGIFVPKEWLEENTESQEIVELKSSETKNIDSDGEESKTINDELEDDLLVTFDPDEYEKGSVEPILDIGIENLKGMKIKKLIKK